MAAVRSDNTTAAGGTDIYTFSLLALLLLLVRGRVLILLVRGRVLIHCVCVYIYIFQRSRTFVVVAGVYAIGTDESSRSLLCAMSAVCAVCAVRCVRCV